MKASGELCKRFKELKFEPNFLLKVDGFFAHTKLITHAQYIAVTSKSKGKIKLPDFKSEIDGINEYAEQKLFKYLCQSIRNVAKFYKDSKEIKFEDIEFASKETHNGKKSVLILAVNGEKLVYKPYDLKHLIILSQAFELIKGYLKYDIDILPKILSYQKEYCILKFLKACKASDNAKFYYSMGVVLAFSYAMRISDLHSENIMISDNSLHILDTEACFCRNTFDDEFVLSSTGLLKDSGSCGLLTMKQGKS